MTDKPSDKLITVRRAPSATLATMIHLEEGVGESIGKAKADASIRAYASDWRQFESWCEENGLVAAPAASTDVTKYLRHLFNEGSKIATIKRALSGIGYAHKKLGFDWAVTTRMKEAMSGFRRQRAGIERKTQKRAATADILHAFVNTRGTDLRGMRDRAILTVQWTGAFRRSEVVYLNVDDVTFDEDGMRIILRKSKTDQEGEGHEIGLPYAQDPSVCSVLSLQRWLKAACIESGSLFRRISQTGVVHEDRLTDHSVARIIKDAAKKAGLPADVFSGHSMRAGFITSAAKAGQSIDAIMKQSGHRRADTVRDYIRHATLFTNNAAKGLL